MTPEKSWDEHLTDMASQRKADALRRVPDGLHANRLRPEADNPREVALLASWRQEHEFTDRLNELMVTKWNDFTDPCEWKIGEATERDRIIAATVIQWLGSNVGMDVLRRGLEACGYRLENVRNYLPADKGDAT